MPTRLIRIFTEKTWVQLYRLQFYLLLLPAMTQTGRLGTCGKTTSDLRVLLSSTSTIKILAIRDDTTTVL